MACSRRARSRAQLIATSRAQEARAAYRQKSAQLDPRRLKFTDESGINLARLFGRAPEGSGSWKPFP
jgi:hypothetical protein